MRPSFVRAALATWLCGAFACESGPPTRAAPPTKREHPAPETSPANGTTIIRGTLVGHDGTPMALAHARLFLDERKPAVELEVDRGGAFELTTEATGYARLWLSGVNHAELRLGLLLTGGLVAPSIKLGTYARPPDLKNVTGFGRPEQAAGDTEPPSVALEFTDAGDGTVAAEVDVDPGVREFGYQLRGATRDGHRINGTAATRYRREGGDYVSIVPVSNGKVRIVLDPTALPPPGVAPAITFADPTTPAARVAEVTRQTLGWNAARADAMANARAEGGESFDAAAASAKLSLQTCALARAAAAKAAADPADPITERALLVSYVSVMREREDGFLCDIGPARRALEKLDADDPLWSIHPRAVSTALKATKTPLTGTYADTVIAGHADRLVVGSTLLARLTEADRHGDEALARTTFAALQDDRFARTSLRLVAASLDPDRPGRSGQPVPAFSFPSLDDETRYTRERMLGRPYLLDFWATWCRPCLNEMEPLHAAYAALNGGTKRSDHRYPEIKAPRLEYLSVSFDGDATTVVAYRDKDWSMPWLHAIAPADARAETYTQFGFSGIPHTLLIDEKGVIVAQGAALRGDRLATTLREFVGGTQPP